MNDFDYDNMLKKRVAQGAKHRKRGSKSKKCSLLSDHITIKQWKEMNGEVMRYHMDRPMTWDEFKSAPKDIQAEYLQGLIEAYNVNAKSLSEMFGVSSSTVRRFLQTSKLGVSFRVGNSMKRSEQVAWCQFLQRTEGPPAEEYNTYEVAQDQKHNEAIEETPSTPQVCVESFSVSFRGKIDAKTIANSILGVVGSGATGRVEVTCTLEQSGDPIGSWPS